MFKPRAELLCSYYSSSGNYTHYPRTLTQFGVLFGEKTFQCQVNTLLVFLQGGTKIISLYLSIIPGFSEKIQFNPSFPYAVYNFSRTIFLTSKLKQGWQGQDSVEQTKLPIKFLKTLDHQIHIYLQKLQKLKFYHMIPLQKENAHKICFCLALLNILNCHRYRHIQPQIEELMGTFGHWAMARIPIL